MTLFVGGPLHGQDRDIEPVPQLVTAPGTGPAPALPPSYVDLATGEQYLLRAVGLQLSNPQSQVVESEWLATVYAHVSIPGPAQLQQGLQHAVLVSWFTANGTGSTPPPAGSNGHGPVQLEPFYVAVCLGCEVQPAPFDSAGERAKWMVAHMELTGHEVKWSNEPREEVPHGSGERTSHVQEGIEGPRRVGRHLR